MNYQQKLNDWFADFEHSFEAEVPTIVAETATTFFKQRFRTEEWDKQPWPSLSPKYAAKKTQGSGRILTKRGFLQASIRPAEVSANRVVISAGNSRAPYARVHNEGLMLKGIAKVKPYTNSNFMGKGKAVKIGAHTRSFNFKMPRRQFMGPSKYLNQEIISELKTFYNK